jgi:hypothetical protein
LDAPRLEPEHRAHGVDELGLGETRYANQQCVAAGKDRDQRLLDHGFLTKNDGADGRARGTNARRGRFGGPDDRLVEAL